MEISICKTFTFEASHQLPFHDGKCRNLHGHSWKLEVEVSSEQLYLSGSKQGMILDYVDLKSIVDSAVIDKLDHQDLNQFFANPTSENVIQHIWNTITDYLQANVTSRPNKVKLNRVRLWETATLLQFKFYENNRHIANQYRIRNKKF